MIDHENLIVLRTFSKWAGLAGLRVGYGVFPEAIMPQLWKIKQPYNVNVAGTVAALESLNDADHLMGTVAKIVQERERLYLELTQLDFLRPYPSQANYILCRVVNRDARQLKLDLEGRGYSGTLFQQTRLDRSHPHQHRPPGANRHPPRRPTRASMSVCLDISTVQKGSPTIIRCVSYGRD